MKTHWQMRETCFDGARVYQIGFSGSRPVSVEVDENGFFEADEENVNLAFGIFAKRVSSPPLTP